MEQEHFRAQLIREGFENLVLVERAPNGSIDDHAHSFEAKALILHGEIRIHTEGGERIYRVGDIFHLPATSLTASTMAQKA